MRRMCLALSVLVALLHVSAAGACINDRETIRTESDFKKHYEFRSGYLEQDRPAPSSETERDWVPVTATVSGLGLLLGSVALVSVNARKQRPA